MDGTVLFQDGLGTRVSDRASGDTIERLVLVPEIAVQESALRDRVSRLSNFRHVRFPRVRSLDSHGTGQGRVTAVTFDRTHGVRLSELLQAAERGALVVDVNAALQVAREILPALAVLHDSRNVTHGAIGPERLILSPEGRVILADHVLALAVEKLQYPRTRLWKEFRIAVPASAGLPRLDARADVAQVAMTVLALVLGRPFGVKDFPDGLKGLVQTATERLASNGTPRPLSSGLRSWLERALPVDSRKPFTTALDAQVALEDVIKRERGYTPAPNSLKALLERHRATSTGSSADPKAGETTTAADASAASLTVLRTARGTPAASEPGTPPRPRGLRVVAGRSAQDEEAEEIRHLEAELARLAQLEADAAAAAAPETEGARAPAAASEPPAPAPAKPAVPITVAAGYVEAAESEAFAVDLDAIVDLDAADTEVRGEFDAATATPTLEILTGGFDVPDDDPLAGLVQGTLEPDEPPARLEASAAPSDSVVVHADVAPGGAAAPEVDDRAAVTSEGAAPAAWPGDPATIHEVTIVDLDAFGPLPEPEPPRAPDPVAAVVETPQRPEPESSGGGVELISTFDVLGEIAPAAPGEFVSEPLPVSCSPGTIADAAGAVADADHAIAPAAHALAGAEDRGSAEDLVAPPDIATAASRQLSGRVGPGAEVGVPEGSGFQAPSATAGTIDAPDGIDTPATDEWRLTPPTIAADDTPLAVAAAVEEIAVGFVDELTPRFDFDKEPEIAGPTAVGVPAATPGGRVAGLFAARTRRRALSHVEVTRVGRLVPRSLPSEPRRAIPLVAPKRPRRPAALAPRHEPVAALAANATPVPAALAGVPAKTAITIAARRADPLRLVPARGAVALAPRVEPKAGLAAHASPVPCALAPAPRGSIVATAARTSRPLELARVPGDLAATPPWLSASERGGARRARRPTAALGAALAPTSRSLALIAETATPVACTLLVLPRAEPGPALADAAVDAGDIASVDVCEEAAAPLALADAAPDARETAVRERTLVATEPESAVLEPHLAFVAPIEEHRAAVEPDTVASVETVDECAAPVQADAAPSEPAAPAWTEPVAGIAELHRVLLAAVEQAGAGPECGHVADEEAAVPPQVTACEPAPLATPPDPSPTVEPASPAVDTAGAARPDPSPTVEPASPAVDTAGAARPQAPRKPSRRRRSRKPKSATPSLPGVHAPTPPPPPIEASPALTPIEPTQAPTPATAAASAAPPRPTPDGDVEPFVVPPVAPWKRGVAAADSNTVVFEPQPARTAPWLRGREMSSRSVPPGPVAPEPAPGTDSWWNPTSAQVVTSADTVAAELAGQQERPTRSVPVWPLADRRGQVKPPSPAPALPVEEVVVPFVAPPAASDREGVPRESAVPYRPAHAAPTRRSLRKSLGLAAAVLLITTAAVGAAYWYMQPGETGRLLVHTSVAGVAVFVDGRAAGEAPASLDLAPGRHTIEMRGHGVVRSLAVEISAGVQTTQRVEWPGATKTGRLKVTSTPPGARVMMGVEIKGLTPVTVESVPVGTHEVVLESDKGTVTSTVKIRADETTELEVGIFPGWLAVFAPVELRIFENGRMIGTTLDGRVMLPPGRHAVQLANPGLGYDETREIEIRPGRVTAVSVQAPTGTLQVEAPKGTEVLVDGELKATAPLDGVPVAAGTHEIVLRHPQIGQRRFVVTVGVKAPARVDFMAPK